MNDNLFKGTSRTMAVASDGKHSKSQAGHWDNMIGTCLKWKWRVHGDRFTEAVWG